MCFSYYGDDLFDDEVPQNSYKDKDSESRGSRRDRGGDTESRDSRFEDLSHREFHDEEWTKTTKTSTTTLQTTTRRARSGRKLDLAAASAYNESEAEVKHCE